ncbi:uncharacterized protein LOC130496526 [Raphanus sativus]|uniref:Uncharacterized protein LOC130496526 n=1 Tax=Raphanus sativus TaxID=3726 RepID=A0A9W3BZB4_RAPSA|nr:uncharacterized protein LOC130496526 [Raphanus sativus]
MMMVAFLSCGGTDDECHIVLSDDVETVKKGCGKYFEPFPEGCFFTSSRGLTSYGYPFNELKPVLRVGSSGQVCSVAIKVDSEAKKESTVPKLESIQNWSQQI